MLNKIFKRCKGYRCKKVFSEKHSTLKISEENQKAFEILVDYIIWLKSNKTKNINEYVDNEFISTEFESVVEAMVYEFYFEKELHNKELYFIKYVKQYFKPIKNEEDEEKPKIIHQSYQILRERNNEIRNNLKLLVIRLLRTGKI